jgi:hypothetical protein
MTTITLFSWGYWGWGNATRQLVEAVDAAEAARGFAPPLFVDVRISRSVRAAGFRDHAFEQLVGKDRYVWLRRLGNRNVETRTGPRIQIAEPEAAHELLDLGLTAAKNRQRLLFFCACERPINDHGEDCHRVTVATLAREAAAARGVAIQTVEWPGGEPKSLSLDVASTILRAVRRGRASLPLPEPVQLDSFAGLAWGSLVQLRAGDEELAIITGPASFQGGRWCLPVLQVFEAQDTGGSAPRKWAEKFRREHGYEPESVGP